MRSATAAGLVVAPVVLIASSAVATAERRPEPKPTGVILSGEWRVSWSARGAFARNTTTGARTTIYRNVSWGSDSGGDVSGYEGGYVVSVVGPIVSFQSHSENSRGSAGSSIKAVDLRRRASPARLTELFDEGGVLPVFLNARPVKERLRGQRPGDLAQLLRMLGTECLTDWKNLLSSFAVMGVRQQAAVVRFGLGAGCGSAGGMVTEFDLLFPIPSPKRTWFTDAKSHHSVGIAETWGGSHEWTCCLEER